MLTPDFLLHISEPAEEIAEQLHQDILNRIIERIMIRLGRGEDYLLTQTDRWNILVLQDAGFLLEDIQREIAKRTKLQQTEIAEAFQDAGITAINYDDAIYKAAGLSPTSLAQSPYLMRLMQRNYEATMGEWKNFTRTTAEAAQRAFIDAVDKAYHLTASGAVSYTQAVREAVEQMASSGVVVRYPTGHTDTVETATLRAVRTGISQATGQIQIARMDEMDVDLVLVSSHLGARPEHQTWQGKVYSRFGSSKQYPDFVQSTGYGSVTGLCGANCRHNFGPYFEGMENPFEHYDSEENKKAYEIQQRQRTLERRIRDTKRDVMARKTSVDNCKDEKLKFALDMDYQRKAALLAKQNKAYNDFCEENGLKRLSNRIQIAKWDRKQAAAARGAAKRYESAKGNTTIPKVEPKPKKPETIAEINEKATDSLLNAYDSRREHFGLNLTPADELRTSSLNSITANYEGVSVDTANSFNDTITKLSKEYYTGFTKIEVMDKKQSFGAQMFATTTHNNSVGQKALLLNPHKTGNFEQLTSRIRELSDNGYAVRIAKGREAEYIPTHEFGHSLMDMKSPLKNFIGMDTKMLSKARKEIDSVYNEYVKEIGDLETRAKTAESKVIFATDQKEFDAFRQEFSKIKEQLSRKRISKYSLANSDEFLAECFTDCRIGANPSDYSKRVGAILDVYFKK